MSCRGGRSSFAGKGKLSETAAHPGARQIQTAVGAKLPAEGRIQLGAVREGGGTRWLEAETPSRTHPGWKKSPGKCGVKQE